MPWQAVAVKPCNCGLLYAKVETEDGPSKRAPSKATCNNLEPWSLAKRHTTSSVTTQAKCEGVKVSLRQHKGSEMTYLPGCSLRNLPSNPLNTNLNFEMPNYVQWAGCGWQIIATKKHGFFHPKATSTVSCVPSNRCNRNFICMGISCIGIYSIYIYTYVYVYHISYLLLLVLLLQIHGLRSVEWHCLPFSWRCRKSRHTAGNCKRSKVRISAAVSKMLDRSVLSRFKKMQGLSSLNGDDKSNHELQKWKNPMQNWLHQNSP